MSLSAPGELEPLLLLQCEDQDLPQPAEVEEPAAHQPGCLLPAVHLAPVLHYPQAAGVKNQFLWSHVHDQLFLTGAIFTLLLVYSTIITLFFLKFSFT